MDDSVYLKYEEIIKNLILSNLRVELNEENVGLHTTCWALKYNKKEFDITLANRTDLQTVVHFFYVMIMKEAGMIPECST